MTEITTYVDGEKDTVVKNYTFTAYANPVKGLPFFSLYGLLPHLFSDNTMSEGLCANWVNGITTPDRSKVWTMGYTLAGQRVSACHEQYTTTNATARSSSVVDYEYEYAE